MSDSLYDFFQSNLKSDIFYNRELYRLYKVQKGYISLKEASPSNRENKVEHTLHIPFSSISTINESFIQETYKCQITINLISGNSPAPQS